MEQTKALNALEPFLALSKSATSPRAAADLITRATSAPNTFIFAELLETPQIQALASSTDHASYLALLKIFSYGTYKTYTSTPGLPALTDAQALKLRQLSLLSLARERDNLSYSALRQALDLDSARQLEDLVVAAVYAGLLSATLDPAREAVQVLGVSPLRDLEPGAIPGMAAALRAWADRCTSTLGDLEAQMRDIRAAAVARERDRWAAEEKLQHAVGELRDAEKKRETPGGSQRDNLSRRGLNKRSVMGAGAAAGEESMDLDEPAVAEEEQKRASKRKL